MEHVGTILALAVIVLMIIGFFIVLSRFKRCPANKILIKYGQVGPGQTCQVIHGGGSFIIPILQEYSFMDLDPITITDKSGNRLGIAQLGMDSGIFQKGVERFMTASNEDIKSALTALFEDHHSKEDVEQALNNWGYELVSYSAD